MKERPILFNGEMVRAILGGRKSQTRRVVKAPVMALVRPPDQIKFRDKKWHFAWTGSTAGGFSLSCPYGVPGDRLWVRETWAHINDCDHYNHLHGENVKALYRADGTICPRRWRPSIHMPRWASRITLEVIGVRVERVASISEADARAEGMDYGPDEVPGGPVCTGYTRRIMFQDLWDRINAKRSYGWDVNPWVWVMEFKRTKP